MCIKHLTLVVVPELTVHCEQVEVYTTQSIHFLGAFLPTSTIIHYWNTTDVMLIGCHQQKKNSKKRKYANIKIKKNEIVENMCQYHTKRLCPVVTRLLRPQGSGLGLWWRHLVLGRGRPCRGFLRNGSISFLLLQLFSGVTLFCKTERTNVKQHGLPLRWMKSGIKKKLTFEMKM